VSTLGVQEVRIAMMMKWNHLYAAMNIVISSKCCEIDMAILQEVKVIVPSNITRMWKLTLNPTLLNPKSNKCPGDFPKTLELSTILPERCEFLLYIQSASHFPTLNTHYLIQISEPDL
jgi:hypothetical protein